MSVFEKASRIKLRFASERGLLDAEDLWDLPLTELNKMAKVLNKDLASVDEEDFLEEETPEDVELKLEFDIVRHVLEIKKEEAKAKKDSREKKAERIKLLAVLEKKQNAGLENMTEDELKARIMELA